MEAALPPDRAGPSRAYTAYALSWLAVGLVLLAASLPRLARLDPAEYLVFAVLALVGNLVVVRFPTGTLVSMQAPFTFASVWLLGWPAAPAINFASAALLASWHKINPRRAAVFAGNASAGMCAAGALFWEASGGPLRPDAPWQHAALLLGAGTLFSLVNTTATVVGRFLETGSRQHLALRNLLPLAGFTVVTYTPVSYLLAVAYRSSAPVFALTVSVWLLVGLTLQAYRASQELYARLEQATRELERMSTTDPLTDLLNRRMFTEVAQRELARHRRYGDPVSVVLLDLRGFKKVNDTLGHQAGDAVLRWVAHVLRRRIRKTDYAFRLGGDEFAVLLPGTGLSGAVAFAESLYPALRAQDGLMGADATLGVASCPEHGATVDELARAADRALYKAREEGSWLGVASV